MRLEFMYKYKNVCTEQFKIEKTDIIEKSYKKFNREKLDFFSWYSKIY
jgi:hypothetical protein